MSLLRSYRPASRQVRGFSSSSSRRVGPESPHFIDVPRPVQPSHPRKPQSKGTLPLPRELFPARRKDKPTKEYLDDVTPLPSKQEEVDPKDPYAQHILHKRKMADMRRGNLREGLMELYKRKQTTEKAIADRSSAKQKRRQEILNQPDREDELLTRPTVSRSMRPTKMHVLPDPNRAARLENSRNRFLSKQQKKESENLDSLHTLYMNARNFIVTDEQLVSEVERVFPEGENSEWTTDRWPGENIWNTGVPPTIQGLVHDARKTENARFELVQERIKKLGEKITGGKI